MPEDCTEIDCKGKFLFVEGKKLYLKAVVLDKVDQLSAAQLIDLGVNIVWLNSPSRQSLDYFHALGMRVVARLGFEGCIQPTEDGKRVSFAQWSKRASMLIEQLAKHPALFAFDLGAAASELSQNRIGKKRLADQIKRAFQFVKKLSSTTLLTCTRNIFFDRALPFLDFESVDLLQPDILALRENLARLQHAIGAKALVLHSQGVDAKKFGSDEQAYEIDQQIRTSFLAGCAGFVVDIATGNCLNLNQLAPLKLAFAECPFPSYFFQPKFSVVVCVYNGEDYIEECLSACSKLDYSNFEVLIINDGSTDRTPEIAQRLADEYSQMGKAEFRLISQRTNMGLSAARNLAIEEASGEFVAYLDSDAFPDEHWLRYLAMTFLSYRYAVVGGPNLNPQSNTEVSDCIDNAPGNAKIVFLDSELCDHVPGCNLVVRRSMLQMIGGFRNRYRVAGDDVDFCWRVIQAGGSIATSPGAMVWHYRRSSIKGYLRQQTGYGRAEALLEGEWPQRFNSLGHQVAVRHAMSKSSKSAQIIARSSINSVQFMDHQAVYGGGSLERFGLSLYTSMPEWPAVSLFLGLLSLPGVVWAPFLVFLPFCVIGITIWLAAATRAGFICQLHKPSLKSRLLVSYLHLAQPFARIKGRIIGGLAPWKARCKIGFEMPLAGSRRVSLGRGTAEEQDEAARNLESLLNKQTLAFIKQSCEKECVYRIDGGIGGGIKIVLTTTGTDLLLKHMPYSGRLVLGLLTLLLGATVLAIHVGCGILGFFLGGSIIALLALSFWHTSLAQKAFLEALMAFNADRTIWSKVHAPRELCEMPELRVFEFPTPASQMPAPQMPAPQIPAPQIPAPQTQTPQTTAPQLPTASPTPSTGWSPSISHQRESTHIKVRA